jgi:hypothetical protein
MVPVSRCPWTRISRQLIVIILTAVSWIVISTGCSLRSHFDCSVVYTFVEKIWLNSCDFFFFNMTKQCLINVCNYEAYQKEYIFENLNSIDISLNKVESNFSFPEIRLHCSFSSFFQ